MKYELICNDPVLSQSSQQLEIFLREQTSLFKKEVIGHAIVKITINNTESMILDDFRLDTDSNDWGYGFGKMIITFMKNAILHFYGDQEHTVIVYPNAIVEGQTIQDLYMKYLGVGFKFREENFNYGNLPSDTNHEMYMTFKRHIPSK